MPMLRQPSQLQVVPLLVDENSVHERSRALPGGPLLCVNRGCQSAVFFRYNIASHFRSVHDNLDVTEIISTAMAKLTAAGPTVGISGELSLFDQERHTQAHEVVLSIHK